MSSALSGQFLFSASFISFVSSVMQHFTHQRTSVSVMPAVCPDTSKCHESCCWSCGRPILGPLEPRAPSRRFPWHPGVWAPPRLWQITLAENKRDLTQRLVQWCADELLVWEEKKKTIMKSSWTHTQRITQRNTHTHREKLPPHTHHKKKGKKHTHTPQTETHTPHRVRSTHTPQKHTHRHTREGERNTHTHTNTAVRNMYPHTPHRQTYTHTPHRQRNIHTHTLTNNTTHTSTHTHTHYTQTPTQPPTHVQPPPPQLYATLYMHMHTHTKTTLHTHPHKHLHNHPSTPTPTIHHTIHAHTHTKKHYTHKHLPSHPPIHTQPPPVITPPPTTHTRHTTPTPHPTCDSGWTGQQAPDWPAAWGGGRARAERPWCCPLLADPLPASRSQRPAALGSGCPTPPASSCCSWGRPCGAGRTFWSPACLIWVGRGVGGDQKKVDCQECGSSHQCAWFEGGGGDKKK